MPDLIAELMELPDFTQDAIDNSVDVAAFKGIKIDSFTKLPLKVRVSHYNDWLNELFKSKGGFVNDYQNKNKVNFDEGGVLQGYADEGFVSLTEEFETMTIDKALEKLAKKESAQAKKGIYRTAEKQLKVVFKEIFPDIVFDKILLKNISVDDTAKFLHLMDKNNFGEKSINTFSALFKHGGLKSPVTTLKELGKYE